MQVMQLLFDQNEEGSATESFGRFPGGLLEQNKVNAEEARNSKAAIVAHANSAESIRPSPERSFPVFSLEESRGRPLPSRRLPARDCYLLSHKHTGRYISNVQ